MVSETHTIFSKYKYGNNFTITIEKKILYGNQFSYHYHMKQYIVKIVTILPYNIYSGNILPTPDYRHANNKINFNISDLKNAESRQVTMNFFHSIHLARMDFALTTDFKSKFWKCHRKCIFDTEHFDSKISKRLINGIRFIVNSQ